MLLSTYRSILLTMSGWQLLIQGKSDPWVNMATDEILLQDSTDTGVSILRFYDWDKVSVTIGRFQSVDTVNTRYVAEHCIPIVRRETGGRGILHDGDITFSIVTPVSSLGDRGHSITHSFKQLTEFVTAALRNLGISSTNGSSPLTAKSGDCFAIASPADIVDSHGVKLLGCAQRRLNDTILQQCSLRHVQPQHSISTVFCGATATAEYPLQNVPKPDMIALLKAAFEGQWGTTEELNLTADYNAQIALLAQQNQDQYMC